MDRYYIERFLAGHEPEIRGHVLEIGDDRYTRMFGADRVTESDVLHPDVSATNATIIADLSCAPEIPSDSFDCVVLTQVLQFVKDPRAVVRTLYRILRPGGVVLATTAGISQVSRWDMERWGDYWRYTDLSVAALFASAFSEPGVQVRTYGNVLTTTAFLHGLAMEELLPAELEYHDPDYQLVIGIRAQKTAAACEAMTGLDSAAPS